MRSLIAACVVVATMVYVNTSTTSLPRKAGRPRLVAVYTQDQVVARINANPVDAMLSLYCNQTRDEVMAGATLHINDTGFTGVHSRKVALWVEDIRNGTLMESHVETIAIICSFHWRQLGNMWFKLK